MRKSRTSVRGCPACKKVAYCGVACQKKDWPVHSIECTDLQSVGSDEIYRAYLPRHVRSAMNACILAASDDA